MTYTPIPAGTPNWDVPVNAAFTSQDSRVTVNEASINSLQTNVAANSASIATLQVASGDSPQSRGFINWSYRPDMVSNGTSPGQGFISMVRVTVPSPTTVTNLAIGVNASGATLTAGQNFLGLYDSVGNRLGLTADLTTRLQTDTDLQYYPLTSPVSVPAGQYYVAFMFNGTTRPSIWRTGSGNGGALFNAGLTVLTAAYAVYATANTSLPPTLNYNTRTFVSVAYWAGLN